MSAISEQDFWREAIALQGSVTPHVVPHVLAFGAYAAVACGVAWGVELCWQNQIGLEIAPYEVAGAGAVLGALLVFRTNAGYERWWEARKLWGGIVNQSRNLAISALSYGPSSGGWKGNFVRWTATFAHVARSSLRGEPMPGEVIDLQNPFKTSNLGHLPLDDISHTIDSNLLGLAKAEIEING